MPVDRFWQIIERAARSDGDPEVHVESMRVVLLEPAEAGMGGPGPSGEPFEEGAEHLAGRYPNLWRRFGPNC